jgi:hypothetical protein
MASKVVAYSGYKANERPIFFFLDNKKIRILEILKQWKDPECDCFRLVGEDSNHYELKWKRSKDQWTVNKCSKNNGIA